MAKVKSMGFTDTAITGNPVLTFPRGNVNFQADFRVKSNNAGKEVVLTNISSPADRPEKIRIAVTELPNVYSGSGVEDKVTAPTKRGVSILAQVTEVISVTDSVDPNYRVDLPVSYHLVIKVPSSEHITSAEVTTGLGRLLSGLFDTGATSSSRLEAILRGSLVPQGL